MRLDRMLSNAHAGTRSQVKKLVKEKRVKVNGVLAKTSSMQIDEVNDEVTLDDIPVIYEEHMYLMLHKPAGYISATEGNVPTVMDLIYEDNNGLFPCGRLDKDTTGMMIITDDGEFAHSILAPKKHIEKTYRVQIDIDITDEMREKFKQGIVLKDHVCCPATIVVEDKNTALITITEGKYHQIKRMFGCFGAKVVNLHRISMGGLQLPKNLREGECRELTATELLKLRFEKI